MNIFELRQRLIGDYSSYIKSFIQIRDSRIQRYVEQELFHKGILWPEPLIQLNPMFEPGHTVDALVADGVLHPACAQIFRRGKDETQPEGELLHLHRHQEEAIRVAREGQSYVLTTGTGSGKSLSYIIPIVDYVLRHREKPGIKAIVVYPMNALANSQLGELKKYLELSYPASERRVTFRRYTGQEKGEERDEIIANPPDILLTNYVMLELILTRLRERQLLHVAQLRFLVLDELHTYRGRQGADVALLVRRVRERLTPLGETLQCIGTSATLAGGGTYQEQRDEVAAMASRVFGCEVRPEHIIGETLMRVTDELDIASPAFQHQLTERVITDDPPALQDYAAFTHDPLSIWLESTFGVIRQPDGRLIRSRPRRISGEAGSAAALLQQITGASEIQCVEAIKQGLLAGYEQVRHPQTGRTPFAFRLHQFISKGDTVYGTLEHDPQRHITLQYQQYAPGGRTRVLFPLAFCRECGEEYYVVRWQDEQSFTSRELHDHLRYVEGDQKQSREAENSGKPGFLYLNRDGEWPHDRDGIEALLPGEWKEQRNGREYLTRLGKKNVPTLLHVRTDGTVLEEGEDDDGLPCFFVPAPLRFCMYCGVSYSSYLDNDFEKLTQLSSEGRSTATTILSLETIRHLREAQRQGEAMSIAPKMLSFTDNRQDASLQAGHFNDFVEIGLLRSALYCAIQKAGPAGLQHDILTQNVFEALHLDPKKYAANPELRYSAKVKTEQALRNVLGYHLYLDLRRGWRITSPNLEQCGLLEIEYQDLRQICEDEELWSEREPAPGKKPSDPILGSISVESRYNLCRTLLDYMRRELAIKVDYLDPTRQYDIKQQSSQHLISPWNIDEDEKMLYAARLFPRSRAKEDEWGERYLSGLSSYGRYMRRILHEHTIDLKADQTEQVIRQVLAVLSKVGLVEEVVEARNEDDAPGYQLLASSLVWRDGKGEHVYHDPLRMPSKPDLEEQNRRVNPFFVDFYRDNAAELQQIQDIHAAEHTAQVPAERREEREEEFRHGSLPILYCSPTMELGVDIAELNVVNMRNIPPTPANYAQRSGRAGRSGQPALVFSYCSTGSSHDQYFFQHPDSMVSGAVAPPRLDLVNEDLVRAHVHAIWLAEAGISLGESLKHLLDAAGDEPTLALKEPVRAALSDATIRERALRRASNILRTLPGLNESTALWYTPNWLVDVLDTIKPSFEAACGRWRGLYRAAQAQRDTQNAIMRDTSRSEDDKAQARRLRSEAEAQLDLLIASSASGRSEFSEFYSYRYFASEGFLPGYNFPRLPLSAYIPARRSKQHDEYLSRPRFLAIAEFAPRAIVYHEGSRYIINRSILSVREDRSGVLTVSVKQCAHCGYLHPLTGEGSLDVCVHCHKPLTAELKHLFRLQNVSTRRRDKINSDEEERLRQGYAIRTGVRFTPRQDDRPSHYIRFLEDEAGQRLAKLTYGQAATLWRINFGPVRRKNKAEPGFVLDTERGYWEKDDESLGDPEDPMSKKRMRVIPYVEDTRNCLLFEPLISFEDRQKQMASLQAALKSAIQVRYQLEDNELAVEPLPDGQNRNSLLFYEAAEGGAGVLRQLIDDNDAVAQVAIEALRLCHFDPVTGADLYRAERSLEPCEAACYFCLMTYANQREHRQLDRQMIRPYLQRLTACHLTQDVELPLFGDDAPLVLPSMDGATDEITQDWLEQVRARKFSLPITVQVPIGTCKARPDFLYGDVAIYVDGPDPARQQRDSDLVEYVENDGYIVLRFREREQWDALFREYAVIFGGVA